MMASSPTDCQGGQIAISCQLCEIETKIQSKCTDCELLMCAKCCEKIHPKLKNAKNHSIVDIKAVTSSKNSENKILDFSGIKCMDHKNQSCCLFCQVCNQLVCPTCITAKHKTHDFTEIEEIYRKKMEELKDRLEMVGQEKEQLCILKQKTHSFQKAQANNFEIIKCKINRQKRIVDRYANELIIDADQKWKVIQKYSENVQRDEIQVEQKMKDIKDVMSTDDPIKFFEALHTLEADKSLPPAIPVRFIDMPTFTPGKLNQSNIGSFKERKEIQISKSNVQLNAVRKFTTTLKAIHYIAVSSDDLLWIGDNFTEVLQKVKFESNKLTILNSFDLVINSMTATQSNDLLVSIEESRLSQISNNTDKLTDSKYHVLKLKPTALHWSIDNRLIVSAISGETYVSAGRKVVIVLDERGNQLEIYEHDNNKKCLFSCPHRITTCNSTIFVLDQLSADANGIIVILGLEKDTKYTGNSSLNSKEKPFKPTDLACTPNDNVIVCEMYTGTLHILDNIGNLLQLYNTENIDISLPYSLAFSDVGKLYIGCSTLRSNPAKADLYEIEYSDY